LYLIKGSRFYSSHTALVWYSMLQITITYTVSSN